jgi:hypothetical protein
MQQYIDLNNQCLNEIQKEKQYIMEIQRGMAEIRKKIPLVNVM